MDRKERTNEKMQELFHTPAAGEEGTDPEFMQILQGLNRAGHTVVMITHDAQIFHS